METTARRLVVCFIFLWFLSTNVFANNEKIYTEGSILFNTDKLLVDEIVEITISFPIKYSSDYELIIPRGTFKQTNISLISAGKLNVISDPETGDFMQFKYAMVFNKSGVYEFPTFEINLDNYHGETKPFTISIKDRQEKQDSDLSYLTWKPHKTTVYKGESFLLTLELKNLKAPKIIDSIELPPIYNFLIEETETIGSIKETKTNETFNIPVASWIFSAQKTGELTIPSIKVKIDENTYKTSQPITINVLPIPKEENYKNYIIGNFSISSSLNSPKVIRSKSTFDLKVRIEGSGNLNNFKIEEPIFDKELFELYKQETNEFLKPSINGYNGYLDIIYKFNVLKDGITEITVPSLYYWNINKKNFDELPSKSYKIKVIREENDAKDLRFLKNAEIISIFDYVITDYAYFFIPFIVAIVLQIPFKRKEKTTYLKYFAILPIFLIRLLMPANIPEPLMLAEDYLNQKNYPEAINYLKESLLFLPNNNSAIHYNLALSNFAIGEKGLTIYHLRKAIMLNPLEKRYQDKLNAFESEMEISLSLPIDTTYPLVMLISTLLTIILFTLTIVFKNKYLRPFFFYLSITSMLVFSSVLIYKTFIHKNYIVIAKNKTLYRIPETKSTLINEVKEGSSFIIKGKNSRYNLLFSMAGPEGWIDSKDILYIDKK